MVYPKVVAGRGLPWQLCHDSYHYAAPTFLSGMQCHSGKCYGIEALPVVQRGTQLAELGEAWQRCSAGATVLRTSKVGAASAALLWATRPSILLVDDARYAQPLG